MHHPPDRLAGQRIDRGRRTVGRDVDDPVLDDREPFPALQIVQRVGPHRHQPADVLLVDLSERAVALALVAHAVDQHVVRRVGVVLQVLGSLRERQRRRRTQQYRKKPRSDHCRVLPETLT